VITYGSFDLFHEGHYRLLERAKALGDYLIVGVTTEQYDQYRGKLNVIDSLLERIENVRKTGFVDEIVVEDHVGQKAEDITRYNIDIFVVGSDWQGFFDHLKDLCEVVYLERTKEISSTMLRAKKYSILRMGIIGAGRIASRFIPESKYVSGVNAEAVYNPNIESARNFASQFELSLATDNIHTFFKNIDAVYIASPHGTHVEYINQALTAGKHVLCEKPLALKKSEAENAFQLADAQGLVLMEAVKTAYCTGFGNLLGVIKSGLIGSVRDVEACFTKLVPQSSREWQGAEAGAFFELASYPLLAIVKILGTNFTNVHFVSHRDENGVDYYTKAYFEYPKSFATAKVGIGVKSEGELIVSGTKGYVIVKSPWWKTERFDVRFEDAESNESFFVKYLGEGLRYPLSEFISSVNGNSQQKFTAEDSIFMADVMDQFANTK